MNSPLWYYARLLGLLALVSLVVGFNFAVWGLHRHPTSPAWHVPGADPKRGAMLLEKYGCGACHTIPGIAGAVGEVGPHLDRMNRQLYVAGVLPNHPPNLSFWIAHPRQADPRTAMPDLGVSDEDARDIAAYLYSLP